MKSKFLIIIILITLLVFTIYKMMKYEESIREEHIITNYIEDESKPLFEKPDLEELIQMADFVKYNFKTGSTYFEKYNKSYDDESGNWESIFLKGVNLGVAVPGKFPAEFSLSFNQYLDWINRIGQMNANIIRVYTILPPEFYNAFAYYNLNNKNKPVYLMQGIWAKVPEDEDYYNPDFTRDFQKEIIDIIDVVHGKAVLKKKQGKASGVYTTDVSEYIIAFLLGREWEPKSVFHTIRKNNNSHYEGSFITIPSGNSMEVWLAKMLDFTVMYETQTYSWQHPLSFVNWLPLDPMYHPTEFIENKKVREYDNDLVKIDFEKYQTTELFKSGIYAAYHVYPYYPDFIYLQDNYKDAKDKKGINDNFYGYLEDLKQHTKGMPLVIAEYGLPSSRGISHFTPSGFNQGGHSEAQQAQRSLTLTEDIYETKCAGAIYFEWADEWFKHNWLVMDFENPFIDRKLWHNMENPEQNFGILALEDKRKIIDGSFNDWKEFAVDAKLDMTAFADATYFYIAARLPGFSFDKNKLYIAIDSYDREKGDHKLPFSNKVFDVGFEFLCEFKSTADAKILVDRPYSVFTDIYNDFVPIYASGKNMNADFIDQLMLVNRGRETLLGKKSDSLINDRSPLIYGNSAKPEFSNADWNWSDNNKSFELRLDWHLINVSDPAKRFVLDDKANTRNIEVSKTEGFNIYLFLTDKNDSIIKQFPQDEPFFYTWAEWDKPVFTSRLKPVYDTLQAYFKNLKPLEDSVLLALDKGESFEITNFYNDKKAAVSLSFDNAGYSQYEYALPVIAKYGLVADFSIMPGLLGEISSTIDIDEGIKINRMGYKDYREILNYGNELALQTEIKTIGVNDILVPSLNKELKVLHIHKADIEMLKVPSQVLFVRNTIENNKSQLSYNNILFSVFNTNISLSELDSILDKNKNRWNIFVYHHIYKDTMDIMNISDENIEKYYIDYNDFRKQIRLIRNSNYWIADESSVFKYLTEKKKSKIEVNRYNNLVFLKAKSKLDSYIYNQPLSIRYKTNSKIIQVSGSAADGTYTNRTGSILLNVYPNKEVKLEIIQVD